MVSVWPTVDTGAEDRTEMEDKGYLVQNDRGLSIHMNWMGGSQILGSLYERGQRVCLAAV